MKKRRGDSVLDRLQPAQREALEHWLCDLSIPYADAIKRLASEFGVRSSSSQLSRFYQRASQRRLMDAITQRASKANAVVEKFEQNPADTYRAALNLIGQIAFDKAAAESLDVDGIYNLTKLMIDARKEDTRSAQTERKLQIEERRVTLLEKKAAQADAAQQVLSEPLTPEQQQQRLRQIFGMT